MRGAKPLVGTVWNRAARHRKKDVHSPASASDRPPPSATRQPSGRLNIERVQSLGALPVTCPAGCARRRPDHERLEDWLESAKQGECFPGMVLMLASRDSPKADVPGKRDAGWSMEYQVVRGVNDGDAERSSASTRSAPINISGSHKIAAGASASSNPQLPPWAGSTSLQPVAHLRGSDDDLDRELRTLARARPVTRSTARVPGSATGCQWASRASTYSRPMR